MCAGDAWLRSDGGGGGSSLVFFFTSMVQTMVHACGTDMYTNVR